MYPFLVENPAEECCEAYVLLDGELSDPRPCMTLISRPHSVTLEELRAREVCVDIRRQPRGTPVTFNFVLGKCV